MWLSVNHDDMGNYGERYNYHVVAYVNCPPATPTPPAFNQESNEQGRGVNNVQPAQNA